MGNAPLSPEVMQEAVALVARYGSVVRAALQSGIARSTLQHRYNTALARGFSAEAPGKKDFETPDLPDEVPPVEEIIERRRKIFTRRADAASARKLIPIRITLDGPIGIAVFGDIHIDSPGSNFPLLEEHTRIVKTTEGIFAGCVGDLQDSWVGRLARLWSDQGVTAREAWKLVEWWVQELADKLIWITEGNHDCWAYGVNGISPLEWIARQQGTIAEANGVRMALHLPCGEALTINCRHDFRGSSQYNPAHGLTKAAMFGWKDDILLAGHRHSSGYNPIKDPMTGKVCHPIRVASYKYVDTYARQQGFPDENISECPLIIIDPDEPDPRHRITVDFSLSRGARVLAMLRREWAARRKKKA